MKRQENRFHARPRASRTGAKHHRSFGFPQPFARSTTPAMQAADGAIAGPDFDVAIIGAGPAGATAAAFARQSGFTTLVLEREEFPRFRIGESLLPQGNAVLRASGVWPRLERAGFIRKGGAVFHLADGSATKEVHFTDGLVPGLAATFQVERATFDALLLDHARELGAAVRLGTTVESVTEETDRCRLRVSGSGGPETLTARWVFDGGGRDRLAQRGPAGGPEPAPWPRRVAIYSHFRGVARSPGELGGYTQIVRLADGWCWLIPLDGERTSVGLVTEVEALRGAPGGPAGVFHRTVAAAPKLRELMRGAEATRAFQVTADYSYFHRVLATRRTLRLGDAAGFYDPIFSSGVYLATWSAQQAVAAIAPAHRAGRALRPGERSAYTRAVRRHAEVFRVLIEAFYDNAAFAVFLCPRPPFALARAMNSIVAGHARLTWPLWWRFQLFRLVGRLQRHLALVPRVDFTGLDAVAVAVRAPAATPCATAANEPSVA
jgi:flavin-dependent dehydrogenase